MDRNNPISVIQSRKNIILIILIIYILIILLYTIGLQGLRSARELAQAEIDSLELEKQAIQQV